MNYFYKIILTAIIFIAFQSIHTFSQEPQKETYSQVRIFAKTEAEFEKIESAGLHIDHAVKKRDYTDVWLSKSEIELLKQS